MIWAWAIAALVGAVGVAAMATRPPAGGGRLKASADGPSTLHDDAEAQLLMEEVHATATVIAELRIGALSNRFATQSDLDEWSAILNRQIRAAVGYARGESAEVEAAIVGAFLAEELWWTSLADNLQQVRAGRGGNWPNTIGYVRALAVRMRQAAEEVVS
jgi:hypothetical protein